MKLDGTAALPLQQFHKVLLFLEVPMLDLKRIRTDFDSVAEKLATRGVDAATLNQIENHRQRTPGFIGQGRRTQG